MARSIGTLSATDPTAGDTFTYTLLNNAGGRFSINGNQLVVANGATLDYETATSHSVTVASEGFRRQRLSGGFLDRSYQQYRRRCRTF